MALAQRLDLAAFRLDPLHLIMRVVGVDLTGVSLTYGVGLYPDIDPTTRLLTLGTSIVPGSDGIRMVRLDRTPAGLPVSVFEIIASKALLAAFPHAAEVGQDVNFSHEFQASALPVPAGFTPVETTLFFGTLTLKGSVND